MGMNRVCYCAYLSLLIPETIQVLLVVIWTDQEINGLSSLHVAPLNIFCNVETKQHTYYTN